MKGKRFSLQTESLEKLAEHAEKKAATGFNQQGTIQIPLNHLVEAPWNARKHYNPQALEDLAKDLLENGQVQAIVVRMNQREYEVIAGSRRLRAARIAGLASLKADVRELDDLAARRLSLSENLEREDLNAYEETAGYLEMLAIELEQTMGFAEFKRPNELADSATVRLLHRLYNELKQDTGETGLVRNTPLELTVLRVLNQNKKRQLSFLSFYRNRLPIMKFPSEVLEALKQGQLEYTKAQVIAKAPEEYRMELLKQTIEQNLSVSVLRNKLAQTQESSKQSLRDRSRSLTRRLGEGLTATQEKEVERLLSELETILEGEKKVRSKG